MGTHNTAVSCTQQSRIMQLLLQAGIIYCSFAVIACTGGYGGGHINDNGDVSAEGDAVNHPGMDATSKACRYDDGPGWSDCDPFELIRFRVLRLIHGGSQCEEMKNITKHCTPHDFPFGTHWLIQEHRKCIAELNRLKAHEGEGGTAEGRQEPCG